MPPFAASGSAYQGGRTATDRYLALKAIGDLASSSPEALAFIAGVQASPAGEETDILEITASPQSLQTLAISTNATITYTQLHCRRSAGQVATMVATV